LNQSVYSELRVYLDQQMYLVRQDFQSNHFGTIPRSSLIYQLQKAFGDFSHENFTAIFGTPHDVIFVAVHDMVIGLVSQHHGERCTSSLSLCQQITMSLIPPCLKAGALRLRLVETLCYNLSALNAFCEIQMCVIYYHRRHGKT